MATCIQCGKEHIAYNGRPGCSAHKSGNPTMPCSREPVKGMTVCRTHGASAPQAKAAAEVRLRRQQLEALVVLGDAPIDIEPSEAIYQQICWSASHVEWYRLQVQKLLPDSLIWGDVEIRDNEKEGLTTTQRAEVNMWLKLYNQERDRLVTMSTKAIAAGLAEREVRMAERTGEFVNQVLRRVLADLELTQAQSQLLLQSVPKHLRAVGSKLSE